MSDNYIRLVPTDKRWQPAPEDAAAATSYVARLFSGPEDDVEEVGREVAQAGLQRRPQTLRRFRSGA